MATNKIITIDFMKTKLYQRTKDGFLDIVNVFHFENGRRISKGLAGKRLTDFFEGKDNQIWLSKFIEKYGIQENENSRFYKINDKIDIKMLKKLNLYKYRSIKNKTGEKMWAHPTLAIKLIGWLNPELDFEIYDIATRELFKTRIVISEMHKKLLSVSTEYLGKTSNQDFYQTLNHEINVRVYGKSFKGIRDLSDEAEYQKIIKLFSSLIIMIENNIVKSHNSLINLVSKIKL
jgi:hypothetical protein